MRRYPNVTGHDLNILRNLSEKQKSQRALKIRNRILKQTHDIKLAESVSPITKNLDQVNESTQKLGEVIIKSTSQKDTNTDIRALPNSSNFSISVIESLGSLLKSHNSLKLSQDEMGRETILGTFMGGDDIKIGNNVYNITPEI